jgi:RNA polymerase sigma-70 factor (ECF subfamily)
MLGPEDSRDLPSVRAGHFVTTHWSLIRRAARTDVAEAEAALSELCRTYWYPLYTFIRRQGRNPHDAEDLTQAFFAKLLDKNYVDAAAKEKGRFRTFLLTALKRFLANEWDREHAQKRGGFQPMLSIDQERAEARFAAEPACAALPDVLFDQQWAAALLDQVMQRLGDEYAASGRAALFELLRSRLAPDASAPPYAEVAKQLHLSEAAIKMAVQRLRARYRQILREEISQTVSAPEEIEDEIRYLPATFSAGGSV